MAYRVRAVGGIHACSVKQEPHGFKVLALPFAKGVHELLKSRRAFDLKEDFVVVIGNFDV